MQPIIKYRGGKSKELHELIPYIPHFEGRYVEPFFGGGAMFFHLEPENAIINDINTPLIEFYKGVRNNYPKLRKELDKLEKIYEKNRKAFDTDHDYIFLTQSQTMGIYTPNSFSQRNIIIFRDQ